MAETKMFVSKTTRNRLRRDLGRLGMEEPVDIFFTGNFESPSGRFTPPVDFLPSLFFRLFFDQRGNERTPRLSASLAGPL
jgi:hypothetical protein